MWYIQLVLNHVYLFIYSFFNSHNIILLLKIYIESNIDKKCKMFLLSWKEPAGGSTGAGPNQI